MNVHKKMIIVWLAAIIVAVAMFAVAWHFFFGVANPLLPQGSVSITTSSTVPLAEGSLRIDGAKWNVEIATSTVAQARGLSYRTSLNENDGMLFIFPSSSTQHFWMIGMNFPLDMIWIGDDGAGGSKVLGFTENVPAPISGTAMWKLPVYASPAGVNKVLEVNGGSVAKYHIRTGDAVVISLPSAI